nr:hypothetical protein BaRGS_007315 [Batillaria attramentaria]
MGCTHNEQILSDVDLDILNQDLALSEDEEDETESENEEEDDKPENGEEESSDSFDESSDYSFVSSADESSEDDASDEYVRCTFCGSVMTRRFFQRQTMAIRSEYITSPGSASVPRCKLCRSPTPVSPLAPK